MHVCMYVYMHAYIHAYMRMLMCMYIRLLGRPQKSFFGGFLLLITKKQSFRNLYQRGFWDVLGLLGIDISARVCLYARGCVCVCVCAGVIRLSASFDG